MTLTNNLHRPAGGPDGPSPVELLIAAAVLCLLLALLIWGPR